MIKNKDRCVMELYSVKKVDSVNLDKIIKVAVPGSKSITNRALLIAALAQGKSQLSGVLFSEDSRYFIKCLMDLGFEVDVDYDNYAVTIKGMSGEIPNKKANIYVGSAGTAARFLTAFLGMSGGEYHIDASAQMRKRPMEALLCALTDLGAVLVYDERENCLPFAISNTGISKNEVVVNIRYSSQFLSALLICGVLYDGDFTIHLDGRHGMSYIKMTVKMMEEFGAVVQKKSEKTYIVNGNYSHKNYFVEPDVSAACYFYAMAPLLGANILVKNVYLSSMQGDIYFLEILRQMGCTYKETPEGIVVSGPEDGQFSGVTVDMSTCSDQTMTLAAIAPFAATPTTITGIGHIKYQESNRIQAIINELTRLGIKCSLKTVSQNTVSVDEQITENADKSEEIDGIVIYPGEVKSGIVETYEDHRMAMAFSLIGLKVPGIQIKNPKCCAKTFENYFDVLEKAVQELER